jgi:ankyrin repeat protein
MVQLLLNTGKVHVDSPGGPGHEIPLCRAASHGHEAIVRLLLEIDKVDVNIGCDGRQYSPLSLAAREGHEAVVRLLLERGKIELESNKVDVISKSSLNGALRVAAANGRETVVKLLLATGKVGIALEDHDERTPLVVAEVWDEAAFELLIKACNVPEKREPDYVRKRVAKLQQLSTT